MKKKSFLIPDDETQKICDSGVNGHIWFVISDPDPDNMVLIVNGTTIYNNIKYDSSCVLRKKDHPFINDDSYVIYKFAQEINILKLGYQERMGKIKEKATISDEILIKIQEGAKKSPLLPKIFEKYFAYF